MPIRNTTKPSGTHAEKSAWEPHKDPKTEVVATVTLLQVDKLTMFLPFVNLGYPNSHWAYKNLTVMLLKMELAVEWSG